MTTFVIRDGELVDKSIAAPLECDQPRLYVTTDTMDPAKHMADGRTYDSKSAFRRATKAAGCVEVGDQKNYGLGRAPPKLDKGRRVEAIKKSIYQLQNDGRR
jgi:hypothetical protein